MQIVFKFFIMFIIYGVAWFAVFSIPIGNQKTVFNLIQSLTSIKPEQARKPKDSKTGEIDKEAVIDALQNAFDK